jgi:hypothetical protein
VEWLWGIGLAFDIAGALLIVFPILTNPRWSRGMLIPQSGPTREALGEVAYTEVGFLLLAAGFGLGRSPCRPGRLELVAQRNAPQIPPRFRDQWAGPPARPTSRTTRAQET